MEKSPRIHRTLPPPLESRAAGPVTRYGVAPMGALTIRPCLSGIRLFYNLAVHELTMDRHGHISSAFAAEPTCRAASPPRSKRRPGGLAASNRVELRRGLFLSAPARFPSISGLALGRAGRFSVHPLKRSARPAFLRAPRHPADVRPILESYRRLDR